MTILSHQSACGLKIKLVVIKVIKNGVNCSSSPYLIAEIFKSVRFVDKISFNVTSLTEHFD